MDTQELFEELVEEGYDEEQAMEIAIAHSCPTPEEELDF